MAMNAAPTGPPPFGPPPSGPARPGKGKVRWLRVLGGIAVIGFLALPCLLVGVVLLALMLTLTSWSARRLGFTKEDEITIVFCGSKKSLASGIPMANVLFDAHAVGAIVLPLMLFHQIQLMVCAVLAPRYARRARAASAQDAVATPSR